MEHDAGTSTPQCEHQPDDRLAHIEHMLEQSVVPTIQAIQDDVNDIKSGK